MDDVFKEQMVKKIPSKNDMLKKVGIIMLTGILSFMAFIFAQVFAPVVVLVLCYASYYIISLQNIEYEYILTNNELDIDIIYNKSKRKRIFSGDIKEIEIMAHIEDSTHKGDFKGAEVIKDYSSGVNNNNTYSMLYNYKSKRTNFIIEPNENMIKSFSRYISPRKLFIKK